MTQGEDPFGRGDEREGETLPGGWLPPAARPAPDEERPERRSLWNPPAEREPDPGPPAAAEEPEPGERRRPVFERSGAGPVPLPAAQEGGAMSGKATAALVFGIVGLIILPIVCSVLAVVLGTRARREIDASGGALRGRGSATAGIVLGWIGLAFGLLVMALILTGASGDDLGVGTALTAFSA